MKEPMSALFFFEVDWNWLYFFSPELKTQAKSLNDFFYFQISLFDFFCGCVPWILFFFVFLIRKKQIMGDTNQL